MVKYLRAFVILTIGLFLLIGAGCRKKSVKQDSFHPILGEWNWVESYGGFAGQYITPDSVGYTKKYVFQQDSAFFEYRNDHLFSSATYTIRERVVWEGDTADVLQIEGSFDRMILFQGNDRLWLVDPCCDLYSHLFIRICSY